MSRPKYRILFLDIDGVLNSEQSVIWCNRQGIPNGGLTKRVGRGKMCPIATSNLLHLLEQLQDLRICVSSTWRVGETLESMQTLLAEMASIPRDRVIGMTPKIENQRRGHEIQAWLNDARKTMVIKDFVIVDDDDDMAHLKPHLIKTSWREGFMRSHAIDTLDFFTYPWTPCAPYEWQQWKEAHPEAIERVSGTWALQYHLPEERLGPAFRLEKVRKTSDEGVFEVKYWKRQPFKKLNKHPKWRGKKAE